MQVGTTHLQCLVKFFGFCIQCIAKLFSCLDKDVGAEHAGKMDCCRVCVVSRLTEVCIVIRVDNGVVAELAAKMLNSEVGDNFVSIHVSGSTCTALEPVSDELVTIFFSIVDELVAGPNHCISNFRFYNAQFLIGHCAGFLNISESDDEVNFLRVSFFGDEEVFFTA